MSVALVNSHVLLPHYPDWRRPIRRDRVWLTTVDRALTGTEARAAMRPKPRERISWRMESQDADELARMLARVEAAMQAGLACAPYWGRGVQLVSAVGDSVTLSRTAWAGVGEGSWVLIGERDSAETFETAEVLYVQGTLVRLSGDLAVDRGSDSWAWPLIFGRPTFGEIEHRTDYHAGVTVTLSEISIRPDPQVIVDICFIDPNGGLESWQNVTFGEYDGEEVLADVSFWCFGQWHCDVYGTRACASLWWTSFSYNGLSYELPSFPWKWNVSDGQAGLKVFLANSCGAYGCIESWDNLDDGGLGSSWVSGSEPTNMDLPISLLSWDAAEYL